MNRPFIHLRLTTNRQQYLTASSNISVSFVIPTLNQATYIRRCIDCCLAQDIAGAEILVQDGGSNDGTHEILRSFGDQIDWVSDEDHGQSDAINKCIQRANGKIIAWINSDDVYSHESVLKTVVRIFQSNPELDIVFGDGAFVDSHNHILRRFQSRKIVDPRTTFIRTPGSPIPQPAVFFRRELFQSVGGLKQELHFAMDQELWMRMFLAARSWKYTPEVLAHLTLHNDAKSVQDMGRQIQETLRVKKMFLKTVNGTLLEYLSIYLSWLKMQCYRLAWKTGFIKHIWNRIGK